MKEIDQVFLERQKEFNSINIFSIIFECERFTRNASKEFFLSLEVWFGEEDSIKALLKEILIQRIRTVLYWGSSVLLNSSLSWALLEVAVWWKGFN